MLPCNMFWIYKVFVCCFLALCDVLFMEYGAGGESGEGSSKYQRSLSMPASPPTPGTPATPTTPSPTASKENVWRSVFHPGSNIATKRIGAQVFDKPSHPNAPTVYDW